MEVNQIISIIEGGETQEVEFKQSFHSSQEMSRTICAFANTLGGILLIGISENKQIIGVQKDPDNLQQQVSAANQSVIPTPLISVEVHKIQGKTILEVIVQKSQDNSYHTFHGAIYVRVGSTTRRIDGQTHLEFLRNRHILCFDESYDPSFTLDDIETEKVKEYLGIRKQERYLDAHTMHDFLLSNKLATLNGELRIKNPVILLFARNTTHFLPQAEIKLVQFSGREAITILSHKLLQESLPLDGWTILTKIKGA